MDWTATMVAAAGSTPDAKYPLDGEDVSSVLSGKRSHFNRKFFWRTKTQGAMLNGKWKYIRDQKGDYLYDHSVDEREQANFAQKQRELVKGLRLEFDAWQAEMSKYPAT
jgi:arylsulfatase A-like enzyme